METPHSTTNTKEFEVTGVSRSGRVRKKSSKLLDFQSPDEVERKIYKRTTASSHTPRSNSTKYNGRGRPSLAAIKARKALKPITQPDEDNDVAVDDEEPNDEEYDQMKDKEEVDLNSTTKTEPGEEEGSQLEDDINDVLQNTSGLTNVSDSDDDGFGELVADLVGTEAANLESVNSNQKSPFRQSLYMTEKNKKLKETRVERKDKGKTRYTAYNMWAREHRKTSKFGKTPEADHQAARRLHELWSNVSNKEKNAWKRKAKMQATRAKTREKSGIQQTNKTLTTPINTSTPNSTFINRPTTSRTRKLAEDKQKAKDETLVANNTTPTTSTPKRPRNNSYRRNNNNTPTTNNSNNNNNRSSPLYIATNGSTNNSYNNKTQTLNNAKSPLPTIEPIDAAAHLKLLGESLSIIGDRLKEHEGQIAVSGSLSVLLDSLLCSLGPLLCLTTRLPGLDKKPQLKANLATTLDNIAYVMPGL